MSSGGNTKSSVKENAIILSKSSTTQENTRISKRIKRLFVQKENFKPKIKPMIENL